MQTSMLSHDLNAEFPDLTDKIHALKIGNLHFSRLLEQYAALDKDIIKSEEGLAPMDDLALENLKKMRLKLKDELYHMLTAA